MVKAYGAAALAVVTKGPVGIVLPGLILLLFIAARRLTQKDKDDYSLAKDITLLFNPLGILLFIVLASPWYIAMYSIHGQEFISGFLGLHNMERALVSRASEIQRLVLLLNYCSSCTVTMDTSSNLQTQKYKLEK